MQDMKKTQVIAAERFQLLAPLLDRQLDAAKALKLRTQIAEQAGLSERTLRRYLARYHDGGFEALLPKGKGRTPSEDAVSDNVLQQAVLLRREVPDRSVRQIIQILEWEGLVLPGSIKRSTLQEKLTKRGYSSRQMRLYADSGTAVRRFQKRSRQQLCHSDIKYGPYLPIGPGGKKQQTYLVTFIDDATRFVLHGAFYPSLEQWIVEDAFRQAIQKYGAPDAVYFDNGKQYRTKWMMRTCSKLGTKLLYAKPYSPEATGKVERFNQLVDHFLAEAALEKPNTLKQLNQLFTTWLEECYQHQPHSALANQMSPYAAFQSDPKLLRFIEPQVLCDAFLHYEQRKVDKAGCISFQGRKYEVGLSFLGCKLDIIYDPRDTSAITIEYEGHTPWQARELSIGQWAGKRPKMPEHLTKAAADSSRLLAGAKARREERLEVVIPAIAYRTIRKEGPEHV